MKNVTIWVISIKRPQKLVQILQEGSDKISKTVQGGSHFLIRAGSGKSKILQGYLIIRTGECLILNNEKLCVLLMKTIWLKFLNLTWTQINAIYWISIWFENLDEYPSIYR